MACQSGRLGDGQGPGGGGRPGGGGPAGAGADRRRLPRVSALDAGADDYLVKPFGLNELLARIRAVLRRIRPEGGLIRHGQLTVDLRTRKVLVSGARVALTAKEFDILGCLAADPGRVQSRTDILAAAWHANWYGPTKVLDVHMTSVRGKLGVPGLIETVYGHGFRLADMPLR